LAKNKKDTRIFYPSVDFDGTLSVNFAQAMGAIEKMASAFKIPESWRLDDVLRLRAVADEIENNLGR